MTINVILSGCSGTMGGAMLEALKNERDIQAVAGISSTKKHELQFPIYTRFADIEERADIIIDFSSKYLLEELLEYADKKCIGLVLGTTGYSDYDEEKIFCISRKVAVFRSANMSYGINYTIKLLEYAVKLLQEHYDIEIIESHNKKKLDAPSGTAKMMINTIKNNVSYNPNIVYEREGVLAGRKKADIGVHSIRGGNVLGNHTVVFAGNGDLIKLEHITLSKKIFAEGAIRAARFIYNKENGYYNIEDLLKTQK